MAKSSDNIVPFRRAPPGGSRPAGWRPPAWLVQIVLHTLTGWLILANVAIWLALVILARGAGIVSDFPPGLLARVGALVPPLVARAPWRLVTTAFLHAGIMHIGFNMLFLGWVGPKLEKAYGKGRFLLVYLASMLGGSLLSWGWHSLPGHYGSSVGASGAIMGVIGALFGLAYRAEGWNSQLTRFWAMNSAAVIVAGWIFGMFGGSATTDNFCHIGGWLAGTGTGYLFAGKPPVPKTLERALLAATAALVVVSFALVLALPPAHVNLPQDAETADVVQLLIDRAEDRIALHHDDDARVALEKAFASGTSDVLQLRAIARDAASVGDVELARRAASKAVALDPGDRTMRDFLDGLGSAAATTGTSGR